MAKDYDELLELVLEHKVATKSTIENTFEEETAEYVNELMVTICESAGNDEISIEDGLELIELLESASVEKWTLKPQISVGNIKFGMSREDVHKLLGKEYTKFRKTRTSKTTTDNYGDFHIFYTPEDTVSAVEIFENINVSLNGKVIFPILVDDIDKVLPGIRKEGNNYIHNAKSIGIEVSSDKVQSIIVGAKGYYD